MLLFQIYTTLSTKHSSDFVHVASGESFHSSLTKQRPSIIVSHLTQLFFRSTTVDTASIQIMQNKNNNKVQIYHQQHTVITQFHITIKGFEDPGYATNYTARSFKMKCEHLFVCPTSTHTSNKKCYYQMQHKRGDTGVQIPVASQHLLIYDNRRIFILK